MRRACPQKYESSFALSGFRECAEASRCASRAAGSGAGGLAEAGDGLRFGVVHVEHREQLGDLENFLELAAEVAESQRRALTLGAVMRRDECAQAGAVDER